MFCKSARIVVRPLQYSTFRFYSKSNSETNSAIEKLNEVISLCKRRGFIYQSSSIYGGLSGQFDYGPVGVQMKKNIKDAWWKSFVENRNDVIGIDTPILLHPKVWETSGHVANFVDPLIECVTCHKRFRADTLLKDQFPGITIPTKIEELNQLVKEKDLICPCNQKKKTWTDVKQFNLLFRTKFGPTDENEEVFLRPETAQGIFINFSNVQTTSRKRIPFGIAQIGKSFRNEISPRDFLFRTREFEQMEMEYFCHPSQSRQIFQEWVQFCHSFLLQYGLRAENIKLNEYCGEDCAHYAIQTTDIEYKFPFGFGELWGIANRTDFDLKAHKHGCGSKKDKELVYVDPNTKEQFIPHCVEPAVGVDRLFLAFLCDAYCVEQIPSTSQQQSQQQQQQQENVRTVLRLHKLLAPIKYAVFPMQKRDELVNKAEQVYQQLHQAMRKYNSMGSIIEFDVSSSIGQLYRRQDEIGTPYCITIDYDTLKDDTITIRDRDSMKQKRVPIQQLLDNALEYIYNPSTPSLFEE